MQRSGRWFRRLARLGLGLVLLAGLLWAGWYVYNRGFTRKWRAQLSAELRRRGLDFEARRLTLNPFEGLVAEDAHLYLLDAHHTPILYISRVAVDISIANLIAHKPFLNSLDLRGARLTIPVDTADPDGPKLRLRRFQAKLSFQPNEVKLTQAQGDFYGLADLGFRRAAAPGKVPLARAARRPTRNGRNAGSSRARSSKRSRRCIRTGRSRVWKSGSRAIWPGRRKRCAPARCCKAEALRRGGYRIEQLQARLDYGAEAFHLRQAELTDARGTLSATGDFNAGVTGEAHFELQSSLDLVALAREFAPLARHPTASLSARRPSCDSPARPTFPATAARVHRPASYRPPPSAAPPAAAARPGATPAASVPAATPTSDRCARGNGAPPADRDRCGDPVLALPRRQLGRRRWGRPWR